MMDYKTFKGLVEEQFLCCMPEEYRDYRVKIKTVRKTNQTLDGLCLVPPEGEGRTVFPTIYVDHMYKSYLEEGNFSKAMKLAADAWMEAYRNIPDGISSFSLSGAKERVVMALINTEQNAEMLKEIPNRKFCDLSIVYRLFSGINENGVHSALIDNRLAEAIGMTEQQLYDAALVNTKTLFPPTVKSMDEIFREMFAPEGMPEAVAETIAGREKPEEAMYVITNSHGANGAVSMLYEEGLHTLAEKVGTDLYILPSSIHEVIAVSVLMGEPEELAEMVREINMGGVALEERLSNQVYHYDRNLRKLELATDTPNKCLGSMAGKPQTVHNMAKFR